MNHLEQFSALLRGPAPLLALAPMQDITDLAFWRILSSHGGADACWTEYFRVYPNSRLDKWILRSVHENPTCRPVVAQMIGHDIPSLVRTARELQRHPVAAIDLNLGCPAPVVYRKCAGGGLLRDVPLIDSILGALREAVTVKFTVKTRLGFDSEATFDTLLPVFAKHSLDLLTVHARTVRQMYRPPVRYDLIARAAATLACPVLANGDVSSANQAEALLNQTKVRGLMIGRGAVRNPWLFSQIRQRLAGEKVSLPDGRDVLRYVATLWESACDSISGEAPRVQRMKKFMNYIADGVGPGDDFLQQIRRATTAEDFWRICRHHLDHDRLMPLEPLPAPPA